MKRMENNIQLGADVQVQLIDVNLRFRLSVYKSTLMLTSVRFFL